MTSYRGYRPKARNGDGLCDRDRARLRRSGVIPPGSGRAAIDLLEQTIAGFRVTRRAANVNGNARWAGRVVACGHLAIFEGITLRQIDKRSCVVRCPVCGGGKSGVGIGGAS